MRRNNTFLRKYVSMKLLEVSLSCLHFSLMFSEGEVKSPCFLQVWWALEQYVIYIMSRTSYICLKQQSMDRHVSPLRDTLSWSEAVNQTLVILLNAAKQQYQLYILKYDLSGTWTHDQLHSKWVCLPLHHQWGFK